MKGNLAHSRFGANGPDRMSEQYTKPKKSSWLLLRNQIFSRERERQNQRQELWGRVENLAASRPEYEHLRNELQNLNINNVITSPDQDDEVHLENMEQEAIDVSFSFSSNQSFLPILSNCCMNGVEIVFS